MLRHAVDAGVTRVMRALWARPRIAAWLAPRLFLDAPDHEFDAEQRASFESLYERARRPGDGQIDYDLPYPKHEFLAYLSREKPVVFHGSNEPGIPELEPREQTDYAGDPTTAVFATKDPLWAMFFAVLDQQSIHGSLRNAGFVMADPDDEPRRHYFFSLAKENVRTQPWRAGAVYILSEDAFDPPEIDHLGFDEWYAEAPVGPIAVLDVEPNEFPFVADVVGHDESESVFTSWGLYRVRRRWSRLRSPDGSGFRYPLSRR